MENLSNDAPAKTMLKVVGIIYIILSGLSIIGSLVNFNIISILTSGWGIFLGVFAVLNCNNLEKAKTLKMFAMIDLIITSGGTIIIAIISIITLSAILGVAGAIGAVIGAILIGGISLILPILLLIGANKNAKILN